MFADKRIGSVRCLSKSITGMNGEADLTNDILYMLCQFWASISHLKTQILMFISTLDDQRQMMIPCSVPAV